MTHRQQMEELAREVLRYFKMRDSLKLTLDPAPVALEQREEWLKKRCEAILKGEDRSILFEDGP